MRKIPTSTIEVNTAGDPSVGIGPSKMVIHFPGVRSPDEIDRDETRIMCEGLAMDIFDEETRGTWHDECPDCGKVMSKKKKCKNKDCICNRPASDC